MKDEERGSPGDQLLMYDGQYTRGNTSTKHRGSIWMMDLGRQDGHH